MNALVALVVLMAAPAELDVSDGRLVGMVDRYLTSIAEVGWKQRAARISQLRTPEDVARRQRFVRQTLLDEIGGFPERTPMGVQQTGTLERDGYRIEKIIYESQPKFHVTANVYVPTRGAGPFPALVGVAGHSSGGKAAGVYQRVWVSFARRGYVVVAVDPLGQGERHQIVDPKTGKSRLGPGTAEHDMIGLQTLLTGTNLARWEIWDAMRAVDYLLTRKDVDPKRIAVAGNSGGGTQSAYLAAMDDRIAVAAPSCYLTSWPTLWKDQKPQDAEQVFTGFLKDGLDFSDFILAAAPRPLQMHTATRDFFPIAGARATYAEARRFYEILGKGDRVGYFEYDDGHGWTQPRRQATYKWIQRWLQPGVAEDGAETDGWKAEPEEALACTKTGQVQTSLKGETVQSMNAALAERLHAKRAALSTADLRPLIVKRLGVAPGRGVPRITARGQVARPGVRVEKLEIESEPGIVIPALAYVPTSGPARKPAVLYVDAAGKAADADAIAKLTSEGKLVLSIDPRGWGEGAYPHLDVPDRKQRGYDSVQRAFLLGKTMVGMQVGDVLRAFDYLAARKDVRPAEVSIAGKGNGSVVALYAAVLQPRIAGVTTQGGPISYLDIVRAETHQGIQDIVVPGVLADFDLPDLVDRLRPRLAQTSTNVLFIAVDDLRPAIGSYGDPLAKTPAIDRLSKAGVRFERAYAQFPLCNPSRSSMLTGRHPSTTEVFDNTRFIRESLPDVTTLPEHFRKNGYAALRVGKIFHGGMEEARSWDVGGEARRPRTETRQPETANPRFDPDFPWMAFDGDEAKLGDHRTATEAIELLERHRDKPFFLGVGFSRPHTPYIAPRRFFDMHPAANMRLPVDFAPRPTVGPGVPKAALPSRIGDLFHDRQVTPDKAREAMAAYYAATSFTDEQVGRVLAALERLKLREKTVVVLFGDHGYHLGEKGKWSKHGSLYEVATRVPLVISAPGARGNGSASSRTVQLLDVYPTLAELTGLPAPEGLEGHSLVSLLREPGAAWAHPAYSVAGVTPTRRGRTVRTERYRYTEWTGMGAGAELYDEERDPHELTNLAHDPKQARKIAEMQALLKE